MPRESDIVLLPLRCAGCQQPVTVVVRPTGAMHRAQWTCPYDRCQMMHVADLGGTVETVVVRGWPDGQNPKD